MNKFFSNPKILGLAICSFLLLLIFLIIIFDALSSVSRQTRFVLPDPPLNPAHGIHAPVGFRWTEADRRTLASFVDKDGFERAPGSVLALSSDMLAANNLTGSTLERDLFVYQAEGAQIYLRMYPQRFPGGLTESPDSSRNTISGTPEDAVDDIFKFLQGQQARTGRHFTRIIPGNEMNVEWSNRNYYYNLLRWRSNDDPLKYQQMNNFFVEMQAAWERKLTEPEATPFRDVKLYFPALSQDGNPAYFGGFYFYDAVAPIAHKYDVLRPAIEAFGNFSWHNYWRPGKAWQDRAIVHFPDWLKLAITSRAMPSAITECGWSPEAMRIEIPEEQGFLEVLRSGPPLNVPIPPHTKNQDDVINGVRFEDDLYQFVTEASGAAFDRPASAPAVMVWLASSGGAFQEAVGIEKDGQVRRWLQNYVEVRS